MVIPALKEENLAKIEEENDKKFECSLAKSERERKSWKTFENDVWNSQRTIFKKPETRCWIDRKTGSINWTRKRLIEFLKQNFNWSKIRLDQSKFLKNSFLEKLTWFLKVYLKAFNIWYKHAWVWDEMLFQNTSFKPIFQGFSPSRLAGPFYPSFCSYFLVFMHFFMHLKGIFGPF